MYATQSASNKMAKAVLKAKWLFTIFLPMMMKGKFITINNKGKLNVVKLLMISAIPVDPPSKK